MLQTNEKPDYPSPISGENRTWEEIMKARSNETLQDWGWKHWPPEDINSAASCRGCRRKPSELEWTFYEDGWEGSAAGGGVQGWIVACPYCHRQSAFLPIETQ